MRKKETIEIVKCDLCGKECQDEYATVNYPVIFHTNQTDGKSCKPYISQQKIDLCRFCKEKTLRISAIGAQGNNEYHLIRSIVSEAN